MLALTAFSVIKRTNNKVADVKIDPRVEQVMNQSSFKEFTILKARKVVAKTDLEVEMKRHGEAVAKIEAELESIRHAELQLSSTTPFLE